MFRHVDTLVRIRAAHQQLIPAEASPFLFLCYPWLPAAGRTADEATFLATRRTEFGEVGFDGPAAVAGLEDILSRDKHLKEYCPTPGHLAHFLDVQFVGLAVELTEAGASHKQLAWLFNAFTDLTYGQGRFKKIALSHLFNFDADDQTLMFGDVRVERLDSPTISKVLGEITFPAFLHPPKVGDYFVVIEEEGPCDNIVDWLCGKVAAAERFAQVLQYFKDGVVHVDYSVPYFLPHWVNQIRKWGIFFLGNPRRVPFENGDKLYRATRAELGPLISWWRLYQSR
ncbi:MAG: hypothetical protein LAP13_26205 [Acidobacteriia bacterium]|nr:hypothetical protein [Terriglobia bacterium]